jgi:hypothetical protein
MAQNKKTNDPDFLEILSSHSPWAQGLFLSRRALENQLLSFQTNIDGLLTASRRREAAIRETLDILATGCSQAQAQPDTAVETLTKTQREVLLAHSRTLADLATIQANTWHAQQRILSRLWPSSTTEAETAPATVTPPSLAMQNWWRAGWWPQVDASSKPKTRPAPEPVQKKTAPEPVQKQPAPESVQKQPVVSPKKQASKTAKTSPTTLKGRTTSKAASTATTVARRSGAATRRRPATRRVR